MPGCGVINPTRYGRAMRWTNPEPMLKGQGDEGRRDQPLAQIHNETGRHPRAFQQPPEATTSINQAFMRA